MRRLAVDFVAAIKMTYMFLLHTTRTSSMQYNKHKKLYITASLPQIIVNLLGTTPMSIFSAEVGNCN